ncbi:hypothetical protein DX910_10110 [Acinetobacter haemolyticus]|nr:hypothetical protein DX910_10110 [Acinetobacter haemolyticus]
MERILIDGIIPLGRKFEKFQKKNIVYKSEREDTLIRDNLKYSISRIFAEILLEIEFPDSSLENFNFLLNEYNYENKVDINLDFYISRGWIRIICGEVLIPHIIHSYIWSLSRGEAHSKNLTSIEKVALEFLIIYQPFVNLDSVGTISIEKVKKIIDNYGNKELSLEYIENNILIGGKNIDKSKLCWNGYQNNLLQSLSLRKEITAHLWFALKRTYSTSDSFKLLIKLIQKSNFWAADFKEYLSDTECQEIFEIIKFFLAEEKDLENSNIEYSKCLFDVNLSFSSRDIDISKPPLYKKITGGRASSIILEVKKNKFTFHDETIYDYTALRGIYDYILELLSNSTDLLKDNNLMCFLEESNKPYLSYKAYINIIKKQKKYIPQLIFIDSVFAVLAFKSIIDLDIDDDILIHPKDKMKSNWREIADDEKWNIRLNIWSMLFEILTKNHLETNLKTYKISNKLFDQDEIYQESIETIFNILIYSSNQAYSRKHDLIKHNYLKKIYNKTIKQFEEALNIYNVSIIYDGISSLSKKDVSKFQENQNFIMLNIGSLHLYVDLIKILERLKSNNNSIELLGKITEEISQLIYNSLYTFYITTIVEIDDYVDPTIKNSVPVIHGVGNFAIESLDWGQLLVSLNSNNLIDNLYNSFKSNLKFNRSTDKYDDQNKNQKEKIIIFLKSSLLAYKELRKKIDLNDLERNTCTILENWIIELSTTYNKNELHVNRIDVFEFPFSLSNNDPYFKPLIPLLFECVNLFTEISLNIFIEKFFKNNLNVNRALEAINRLNSLKAKSFINNHIKEIDFESFVDSVPTISEIESTMINAVNSNDNWILAKNLVDMVINHYNKRKYNQEAMQNLTTEVKLLLAFKEKDIEFIENIISNSEGVFSKKILRKALYFQSLHFSYNEHSFYEAEKVIESLISLEKSNINYNFQMFRLNMLNPNKSESEKIKSYKGWGDFFKIAIASNDEENLKEIQNLMDYSENLSLIALSLIKNYSLFDQIVNRLPSIYLYNEETMEVIFHTMQCRNLITNSLNFLTEAREYYNERGIDSKILEKLEEKFPNLKTITEIQNTLSKLPSINADIIPKILPISETNSITNLYLFICYQLILSMNVIKEKFKAIRLENEYNDLVLALLRLRISLWDGLSRISRGWDAVLVVMMQVRLIS